MSNFCTDNLGKIVVSVIVGFVGLLVFLGVRDIQNQKYFSNLSPTEYERGYQITKEVERVFMHMPGEYSFFVRNSDGLHAITARGLWFREAGDNVSETDGPVVPFIITDVPADKPMYVEMFGIKNSGYFFDVPIALYIHIHAPEDVGGGGWKSGGKWPKSYETIVIE